MHITVFMGCMIISSTICYAVLIYLENMLCIYIACLLFCLVFFIMPKGGERQQHQDVSTSQGEKI